MAKHEVVEGRVYLGYYKFEGKKWQSACEE